MLQSIMGTGVENKWAQNVDYITRYSATKMLLYNTEAVHVYVKYKRSHHRVIYMVQTQVLAVSGFTANTLYL